MNLLAEQIVKGLMYHGIRVTVNANGDLSLRGMTKGLTENHKRDLQMHKPEIVHYLTEQPFTPVVMYVASDLEHWTTDEPHIWADKVGIFGKDFVRLSPSALLWLKERVQLAETACNRGKIAPEAFERIVKAFCPIYDFAVCYGLVAASPALAQARATAARKLQIGTSGGLEV